MATTASKIRLSPQDAKAAWGKGLQERAEKACQIAEQRLGLTWSGRMTIRTFASEYEFHEYLQSRPEGVVAIARPRFREIVILRSAWVTQSQQGQNQTLIHEMVHMLIGKHVKRNLPTYIEEGLAMIVARQETVGDSWRILLAGTLGSELSLASLEKQVAIGGGRTQTLAYALSHSITRFYLKRAYPGRDGRGDTEAFGRELADPVKGPRLMNRLWDPHFRYALEFQWKREHGSFWKWFGVFSGGTLFWTGLSAFVVLAWWRKKRMAQMVRERFTLEEERDAELGLDIPPWEYEGDDDEGTDKER